MSSASVPQSAFQEVRACNRPRIRGKDSPARTDGCFALINQLVDKLEKVSAATGKQDWAGAQGILRDALARDSRNADYHNLLAYAIRHEANPDMDTVFKHYGEALRIDPKHRGAHEYIGEAYLMTGNVAKAREHLAALDKLCVFSCEEYRDLKKAIERFEAQKK